MTFSKIAVLDALDVVENTLVNMGEHSSVAVGLPSADPADFETTLARSEGAEAVVVTWRTRLDEAFFVANPQLRFVSMAASRFIDRSKSSIDLDAAARHGVTVSCLGQYGDEATAEWVIATMLNSAHHIDGPRWQQKRRELFDKQLGIIGLSHVGSAVALRAAALGMRIAYSSRSEKPFADNLGYVRMSTDELLATSDVVTVHVAKGVRVMDASHFAKLPTTSLLINTSIGDVMDPDALRTWLANGGCCVGDATISPSLVEVMNASSRGWVGPVGAADTLEMRQRRSDQLIESLAAFLDGQPVRVVA